MKERVEVLEESLLGYNFVTEEYLEPTQDEYYYRNLQNGKSNEDYRHLTQMEIDILEKRLNTSNDWSQVLVSDPFDPYLIKSSSFYGLVRIGKMENKLLRFHDFVVNQGITNSRIISCDIQDYVAIHDVKYLSHYIIKKYSILHRIGEMQTTNHAKFGIGIVKEGEQENVRVNIALRNENMGRRIYPFLSLTCGDAYLWSTYRSDKLLMEKLDSFTKATLSDKRGFYGVVEEQSVIKECLIIKDVNFGKGCYVKGANKLKNLTIKSELDQSTQIGEGVELVNGIVNTGCHIFYGVKAVRFVIQDCANLKYGARLINSVLGDNSTISCCEVLNNLVFPSHEQHHNNSFLISSLIMGQSNMAAGANIGSNHNSRASDGELIAGRGFWPALSSTLKYDCRFASFTLIAKGNYPNELNLKLPFCLLSSDMKDDVRIVMPAYWWMYNMYALERNSLKTLKRDRRKHPRQVIENNYLAPDTIYEIAKACDYLKAEALKSGNLTQEDDFISLLKEHKFLKVLTVKGIENKKEVKLIKWQEGLIAYYQMLCYYAVITLINMPLTIAELERENCSLQYFENYGGQLLSEEQSSLLKESIKNGSIKSWDEIHQYYKQVEGQYQKEKGKNAIAVLHYLYNTTKLSKENMEDCFTKAKVIRRYIEEQVFTTKIKDYDNQFRLVTYNSEEERDAILGCVEDNSFIEESKQISLDFYEKLSNYSVIV